MDLKYAPVKHDHTAFLAKAAKRRGFRQPYDALEVEYALVREMLAARARAGLTQEAVAVSMGTTKSAVSRLEAAMSKKITGAVSHHEREVTELRADRELAVEYLKVAMASLDDLEDRAAGLLALRTVAEAYGGLGAVAAEAGISREALYRALSAKGNPTLKTILAVLKAVGMRLSVEQGEHATA